MKFINRKIEEFTKKTAKDQEIKSIENAKSLGYEINTNVPGYGFDGHKLVMEYVSKKSYDKLLNGNTLSYILAWYKADNINRQLYNKLVVTDIELMIKEMEAKGREPYSHLPLAEQEGAWYKEYLKSAEFKKFLNLGLTFTLVETYKKITHCEEEPTLVVVDELKEIFPKVDTILVCEEMKIIILLKMMPIYGPKDINTTLDADFDNSPYFNDEYIKKEGKEYYENFNRSILKIKDKSEVTQEKVEAYLMRRGKKEPYFHYNWNKRGREYSYHRTGMPKVLKDIESKELQEILNTYIMMPGEIMYKPFINETDLAVTKYNISVGGTTCVYKKKHIAGCTREELQKRLDAAGYITDYYNVDRSNTYDYSIEETAKTNA